MSDAGSDAGTRRAWQLLATSLVARLPQAVLGLALMVHGAQLTGSLAAGGMAAGGFALGIGTGGPWWGRRADALGPTTVLVTATLLEVLAVTATALLPVGTPVAVLVAGALASGLTMPPVGAVLRAALPRLVTDPDLLHRTYGAEATALELTFIAGPALALGLAAATSTSVVLVACAALLGGAVLAYLAQTSHVGGSASGRAPSGWTTLRQARRNPRLLGMTVVMALVGTAFGATEVGVVASTGGHDGAAADAGVLLAAWGLASLVGGVVQTWRNTTPTPRLLAVQLRFFAVGHLLLAFASHDRRLLALALVAAGATIAPLFATVHSLASRAVSDRRATEAFSWLASATAVGSAAGAALGGPLAEAHPEVALGLAGSAALGAAAVAWAGSRTPVRARPAAVDERVGEPRQLTAA